MGNSKYLDSLTKEKYDELSKKLYEMQNHKCFICQKDIDLDLNNTNIDHIKPLANGGKDEESNFAITHEHCNKTKKDADLVIARKLLQLEGIINDAENKNETPSLDHVLRYFDGSKYDFKYKIEGDKIKYTFTDIGDDTIHTADIFVDELSKEQTCFISVPLEYLFHDKIINPRGINSSIGLLIKEFYKTNPQLHLSLARIDDNKIKIFDGQHKAVAQLMLGVKKILVRVFINPNVDRLTETNTNAGSKLKQIAFDKSIVRQLHETLYAETLTRYQKEHSLSGDDFSFSEQNVVDHFRGQRANVKLYIVNSQKNCITRSADNKLLSYINFEGRGNALPLSYSTFEKTFLSRFINAKTILTCPINDKIDEGLNKRMLEKQQLVKLCNIIAEELLIGRYDVEIGTYRIENNIANGKGNEITDNHLIAYRLFKEEIIYNWMEYLERLIKNSFAFTGTLFDEDNLFMQSMPETLWDQIRNFIVNLRELPIWKDRSMSATIFGGKNNYAFWSQVFKTGKTPEGVQVLAEPLNVINMIKKP